jgi:hypothetical protein
MLEAGLAGGGTPALVGVPRFVRARETPAALQTPAARNAFVTSQGHRHDVSSRRYRHACPVVTRYGMSRSSRSS